MMLIFVMFQVKQYWFDFYSGKKQEDKKKVANQIVPYCYEVQLINSKNNRIPGLLLLLYEFLGIAAVWMSDMSPTTSSLKTHAGRGPGGAKSGGGGADSGSQSDLQHGPPYLGPHGREPHKFRFQHNNYATQIRNTHKYNARKLCPYDTDDGSTGLPTPTPVQMSETEVSRSPSAIADRQEVG